jgi:hypothetical protein
MSQNSDLNIGTYDLVQSRYTYVQAAGSTEDDGTTAGIHLRWDFRGELGEKHLPKGNLANSFPYITSSPFNKDTDFVRLYKVKYAKKYPTILNLYQNFPVYIDTLLTNPVWEFSVHVNGINGPSINNTVLIRFSDADAYSSVSGIDPYTNPAGFIEEYFIVSPNGHIEIETPDKLAFSVSLGVHLKNVASPGINKVEAISDHYEPEDEPLYLSCRKVFNVEIPTATPLPDLPLVENTAFMRPKGEQHSICVENIKYIRVRCENLSLCQIMIETYHDYITGVNNDPDFNWEEINNGFSLSLDDTEIYERLDNGYNLQNWPRFKGSYNVNVNNYKDKWTNISAAPGDRIKNGVTNYLENSTGTNLSAEVDYPYDPQVGETGNMTGANPPMMRISYLDMLRLVSLDYHIARMLGLGYIDAMPTDIGEDKFIYLILYKTETGTGLDTPDVNRSHFSMTLPVSKSTQCIPNTPVIEQLRFGIEVPGAPPILLGDTDGYMPYDDIRYVRVHRTPVYFHLPFVETFFEQPDEFCSKEKSETVFYGIGCSYKIDDTPQSVWQDIEISLDESFSPSEIMPIPNPSDQNTAVYTHAQTQNGHYKYSLYAINWFSRASELSGVRETTTSFPIRNTLLPPSDLAVQVIQKENPVIFTTQQEQDMLNAPNPPDILVRATFSWNHIHNMTFQPDCSGSDYKLKADIAHLFFNEQKPSFIRGKIISVTQNASNIEHVDVLVGPYTDASDPSVTVTPVIAANAQYRKFVSDGKSYDIISITDNGGGSILFVLKRNSEYNFQEPNTLYPVQTYTVPIASTVQEAKYFSVNEDLSEENEWDLKLSKDITLIQLKTLLDEDGNATSLHVHRETVEGIEGAIDTYNMGGIFEWATVTEKPDIDVNGNIPNSRTGVYDIEFTNNPLPPHSDSDVSWYKGIVRIAVPTQEEKRILNVININNSGANLVITVVDSTFDVDGQYFPQNDYLPIPTGTVLVNFHPGYKVYLRGATGLSQGSILPAGGAGVKQTYMAVRSCDSRTGVSLQHPLYSEISTPSVLVALEIVEPQTPGVPMGPIFATRPDFYGKSTYTFDTEVIDTPTQYPNALVFYRADNRSILDKLYLSTTISNVIIPGLAELKSNGSEYLSNYWQGLVKVEVDSSGNFIVYDPNSTFYFPPPDNDNYKIPGSDPEEKPFATGALLDSPESIEKVKNAIAECFIPLTEEPVIYNQLQVGTRTSKTEPLIRDANGRRLAYSPDTTEYWQAPMAAKLPDNPPDKAIIRFTDYKLDGASNAQYFYCSVEMTNRMQFGDRCAIAGPVRLINSMPPEPPQIKKVISQLSNPILSIRTAVKFEINNYLPSDNVVALRIYRTTREIDTKSVLTMKLVKTVTEDLLAVPPVLFSELIDQLEDDFEDLGYNPLYGDPLYYRLVALRKIKNEADNDEFIPSEPSNVILASIVDTVNPEAPVLSYESDEITTNGILPNVILKWEKTVHNGKYYLYKMTSSGNWTLVETIVSNDIFFIYPLGILEKTDDDNNPIYHRYRVKVENSSGLLNLVEKELTI